MIIKSFKYLIVEVRHLASCMKYWQSVIQILANVHSDDYIQKSFIISWLEICQAENEV